MQKGDRLIADSSRVFEWMHKRTGIIQVDDFVGIAREVDGRVVAAFGYDNHGEDWCFMHACIEPHALNRCLLQMAFDVPFGQWGYEYVFVGIQESNKPPFNLASKLGFIEFDILPRVYPTECLRFMVMHKSDCRWVNLTMGRV